MFGNMILAKIFQIFSSLKQEFMVPVEPSMRGLIYTVCFTNTIRGSIYTFCFTYTIRGLIYSLFYLYQ